MNKLLFLFLLLLAQHTFAQNTATTRPFTIGVIDSLPSKLLGETRTLNIYLPAGYGQDPKVTYPVIYLLDGGADEDFIHIAGLVQYFNFPWINRFPESIVVGIANTNRKRDFTYAVPNLDFLKPMGFDKSTFPAYGGSATFINFIEKELQPYIAGHYHIAPGKTLIGQSLGGLLATEILLKKTSLFDTYILISPSLWWGNESLLRQKPQAGKPKVYLAIGNEGTPMVPDAKQLAAWLKQNNIPVVFDYLGNEDHATIGHQAVMNAFRQLYPAPKQ
ncbi:alpha/beta hydrolase [Taibaiella koreensis]|uniref:alpha/beta hydrolase n=1 Tax=Taibaiella koreensis TaxID=1268548 RepID=UPI000E5A0EE3|nr:alpha/beta hydrolase-fold protein [Taibaiella koreensis]